MGTHIRVPSLVVGEGMGITICITGWGLMLTNISSSRRSSNTLIMIEVVVWERFQWDQEGRIGCLLGWSRVIGV